MDIRMLEVVKKCHLLLIDAIAFDNQVPIGQKDEEKVMAFFHIFMTQIVNMKEVQSSKHFFVEGITD